MYGLDPELMRILRRDHVARRWESLMNARHRYTKGPAPALDAVGFMRGQTFTASYAGRWRLRFPRVTRALPYTSKFARVS